MKTYRIIIANETSNYTSTKYNNTLNGFASEEAASKAAKEALRDAAGEMNKGAKVFYSETLNAWILANNGNYMLVAKIEAEPNTPVTMNANNIHVNNIVATLNERNEIRRNIELPALAAISKTATKFDGKVFNRRFTAAVTKTLESNANRITVTFRQKYDGTTEYDIIRVHYCYNGKYSEFTIYPDRVKVQDYTDNAGRLVAEKLIETCKRHISATLDNIQADENAISRTPEFVARVEAVKSEVEAINNDFPLSLCARFTGNIDFRR